MITYKEVLYGLLALAAILAAGIRVWCRRDLKKARSQASVFPGDGEPLTEDEWVVLDGIQQATAERGRHPVYRRPEQPS